MLHPGLCDSAVSWHPDNEVPCGVSLPFLVIESSKPVVPPQSKAWLQPRVSRPIQGRQEKPTGFSDTSHVQDALSWSYSSCSRRSLLVPRHRL